MIENLGINQRD